VSDYNALIRDLEFRRTSLDIQAAKAIRELSKNAVKSIQYDTITIYLDHRFPEINGKPIEMRYQHLVILIELARHGRKFTSVEHLCDVLWNVNNEPMNPKNVIHACVCRLRSILKEILGYDSILCKRGVGYRLADID
jgi:DNA-binding response OmpR family regulator